MLRLGVIGFDAGFLRSFSIALKNRGDGIYVLASDSDAQILLVDTDSAQGQEYLKRHSEPTVPMLAVVSAPESLGDTERYFAAVLPKPLQFSRLMTAINALVHEHYAEYLSCLLQPDVEKPIAAAGQSAVTAASQIAKVADSALRVERASDVVQIDEFLLGMVFNGIHSARTEPVYAVQWPGGAWLAIERERQLVSMSLKLKMLRPLALVRQKDQDLSSSDLTDTEFARLRERTTTRLGLEEFLWLLTHWTVRSDRVHLLDIHRVYRLNCWPNLTRYSVSDMDLPLANYWMSHPSSVTELSEQLNIVGDKLLPFASCCLMAGFLQEVEPSAKSTAAVSAAKSNPLRGVLHSLLGRFARKS